MDDPGVGPSAWPPTGPTAPSAFATGCVRIGVVIPPKKPRDKPQLGRPVTYNANHYRGRNVVERCVGWLKECRALATRYEKLAVNYLNLVKLAMIERYLRLL